MSGSSAPVPGVQAVRFRVFIDFWNLQLTLNKQESRAASWPDARFKIDWHELPMRLVEGAAKVVGASAFSYEGSIVFASYNPTAPQDRKLRHWLTSWLDRQPGVQVKSYERRPKTQPRCPVCHRAVTKCPYDNCGADLACTVEKGVDTAIATDMIRLAWERAYEVAILVSSDADLVPAVEFLDQRGFKIVQAGFPPLGSHLSRACWATIDLFALREGFRRA